MAVPTKGNVTNANPTPGANFKTQSHNHNTGADGLIVECHPNPPKSISDADQAIGIEELKEIMEYVNG